MKVSICTVFSLCLLVWVRSISVERKQIVDNGGYIIRNARNFSKEGIDLVMEARPVDEGDGTLGPVILSPNEYSRSQKWGVAYYGGDTAYLGPGLNSENTLSLYKPSEGPFGNRLFAKRYQFQNCYGNENFKIIDKDREGFCVAVTEERNGTYFIGSAPCNDDSNEETSIFWTFERYG